MLNDNFAECPKCKFNLYSHEKKNNGLISNINKKFPKVVGDIGEQITTQVKKEESFIKNRLNDDSTDLVDDNEFFISKKVFDGIDYISGKKQEQNYAKEIKNTQRKEDMGVEKAKKEEEIKKEGMIVEDETELEQEVSVDETDVATEEPIEEKVKSSKEKTVNPSTKTTQNKKKDNNGKKQKKGIGRKIMDFNLGKAIMDKAQEEIVEKENIEVREKISPLLPEYARVLNTTPNKLYVTYMFDTLRIFGGKYDTEFTRKGIVMIIEDTKISYIVFGYVINGVTLFDTYDIHIIPFKHISSISPNSELYVELKMTGDNSINIRTEDYFGKKFLSELLEKYNKFITNLATVENNSSSESTNNADELLKYAELYKQDLLSEEEFEAKKKELL